MNYIWRMFGWGNKKEEDKKPDAPPPPQQQQQQQQQNQPYYAQPLPVGQQRQASFFSNIVRNGGKIKGREENTRVDTESASVLAKHGAIVGLDDVDGEGSEINILKRNRIMGKEYPKLEIAPEGTKEYYPMGESGKEAPQRGYVVVLNYEKYTAPGLSVREGTKHDVDRIEEIFAREALNFVVQVYEDEPVGEIDDILNREINRFNRKKDQFYCFVVVVLAHGKPGYFFDCQGGEYPLAKLFNRFDNDTAPELKEKPKLFFIQACRGEKVDHGAPKDAQPNDTDEEKRKKWARAQFYGDPIHIPTKADQLVFYCCYLNYLSYRDKTKGTWFIEMLHEVFLAKWREWDLSAMLTEICGQVAEKEFVKQWCKEEGGKEFETEFLKQMPQFNSTLTKHIKFY